jgi:hypothetical protein
MLRFTLIFSSLALLVSGCGGKKTQAQEQEEERQRIREEKRKNAVIQYKRLAEEFPDYPKAAEAAKRAKELEAAQPKK